MQQLTIKGTVGSVVVCGGGGGVCMGDGGCLFACLLVCFDNVCMWMCA